MSPLLRLLPFIAFPGDQLLIRNQGAGSAKISQGPNNTVAFSGIVIDSFTGGTLRSPLVISLGPAGSKAAVQALVRNLTFNNLSENPSIVPRTVQLRLTDGYGGTSAPVIRTINVTSIDDAPLVNGFNEPATYFIQGTPVILDIDATVTDVDSAHFDAVSLTVSLATNRQATDQLSVACVGNGPGQIRTSVNPVTSSVMDLFHEGVLIGSYPVASTTTLRVTLNGSSSSAAAGALLRRVAFYSTSATPPNAVRTVQVSVNYGDGKTSLIAAKTITIKSPVTPATPAGAWTNGSPRSSFTCGESSRAEVFDEAHLRFGTARLAAPRLAIRKTRPTTITSCNVCREFSPTNGRKLLRGDSDVSSARLSLCGAVVVAGSPALPAEKSPPNAPVDQMKHLNVIQSADYHPIHLRYQSPSTRCGMSSQKSAIPRRTTNTKRVVSAFR